MNEQILFLQMFSQYLPDDEVAQRLKNTVLTNADIDPQSRKITVELHNETYLPHRLLANVSEDICDAYGLHDLPIHCTYP